MAMYHCDECGRFLDDDWHPMSDLELCPDCHPEGWTIEFNPKPIPDRKHDWDFWHEDNDVDGKLCGTAASLSDALEQIHDLEMAR